MKLRICRITSAFIPPWLGLGPGPYGLSCAQHDLGHDLTVITKYYKGCEDFDKKLDYKVVRIKAKHNLIFSLLATINFLQLHASKKFDLIHNHGDSALFVFFIRRLFHLDIAIVSSIHIVRKHQANILRKVNLAEKLKGFFSLNALKKLYKAQSPKRERLFEKLIYVCSDALAAVNDSIAQEIQQEYKFNRKIDVIYNGFDYPKLSGPNESSLEVQNSPIVKKFSKTLLFIGALNGRKGEFDLINAMYKIVFSSEDIGLIIIGQGPSEDILKTMVKKTGLQEHISVIPTIEHANLKRYFSDCDLFILPSYSEGLPKVLLEAMACGIPVVVSDIPAHRKLIKHSVDGYMFKTSNVDSLASTIMYALANSQESENITQNARNLVKKEFTWQSVARRLDEVYCRLLGKR